MDLALLPVGNGAPDILAGNHALCRYVFRSDVHPNEVPKS